MTPQTSPDNEISQTDSVELIEPDSNRENDQFINPINEEQEAVRSSSSSTISSLIAGIKSVAYDVSSYWAKRLYDAILSPQDPQAYYKHLLEVASNYEQCLHTKITINHMIYILKILGKDKWKTDPVSPDYDYDLLVKRLKQLKEARRSGDLSQMIFLLRTSLARNLADMGQPKLYAHTNIGTKKLIEDYINEVVKQMNIICDTESEEISAKYKLDFFINTRQSFGRTALLLSGGATFGLTHIGVIKCLHECKLLPRVISGASSGSIIAALLCTKTDDEIPATLKAIDSGGFDLEVFQRESDPESWNRRLNRFLRQGVFFDVKILRDCMQRNIPDMTFLVSFWGIVRRTRRILNITVTSSTKFEMQCLLNYLTAPNVLIWSAVAASCSVPFIYSSSPLLEKDKNGKIVSWNPSGYRCIDGSVENDLPMNKISELFNVNHFIVLNPHVVPFLETKLIPSPISRVIGWFLFLAFSELQHRLNQLREFGIMSGLIHRLQAIILRFRILEDVFAPMNSDEQNESDLGNSKLDSSHEKRIKDIHHKVQPFSAINGLSDSRVD
ncbi:10403_t:CDS:10 [Diversispora eburnea]|uniref:10403_t:CDS:1 n=1 Tax=Diversispora eburnea TaxID=1213867 RepID=A0A9N8V1B7_9GLOM|nr:10403_t:CDS:10 [Diversispora eburnea]